tara:strand:- start:212 stop:427 length:216 start_codon:yes stop_codon:yes gene_type:complete
MNKNKIPTHVIYRVRKLVDDLFWEYDRLSSSGKAQLDEIATHLNLPTQAEIQEIIEEKGAYNYLKGEINEK